MQSSMDSSPKPQDLPDSESTAASDPSTTRPKPFDDDDDDAAAARKRRRTSASVSPVASSSVVDVTENPSMTQPTSTAITAQPEDTDPRTPEPMSPDSLPASQPSSSKVTINLRRLQGTEHAVVGLQKAPISQDMAMDEVEELVDTTSLTGSATMSRTNTIPDDGKIQGSKTCAQYGNNTASEAADMAETQQSTLIDPSEQFPFRENFSSIEETLERIADYLSADPNPGERLLEDLLDWTELTVTYIDEADQTTVRETCHANAKFWSNLPDILAAVTGRRTDLSPSSPVIMASSRLSLAFASLTARFIALDCETLGLFQDRQDSDEEVIPPLFSVKYQQQFYNAVKAEQQRETIEATSSDAAPTDRERSRELMMRFQQCRGGNIGCLTTFVNGLTQVTRRISKTADSLTPVTQLLAIYMQHSRHAAKNGDDEAMAILQQGFDLWRILSSSLDHAVEKQVTYLGGEMVSKRIQSLSQILSACLHSSHRDAQTMLDDCKRLYPDLPADTVCDAVAWDHRIRALVKLVKSTQMQLRVMAVGTLSTELIMYWKRLNSMDDDDSIAVLRTLGAQVLRTGLIEYIIVSSCHPEIIIEAANIIAFLAITKLYGKEQADLVWNGILESQDPRISESICRMLTGIIQLFDRTWLLDFCHRFKSMRMDQFSLASLSLLEAIFRELMTKSKADDASVEYLPIELCCHILRNASLIGQSLRPAYPDLHRIAQTKLRELLEHCRDSEPRGKIYSACIKDLQSKSETTLGSLWCLSIATRPGIIAELALLSDQHNFVHLLVDELGHSSKLNSDAERVPILFGDVTYPRRDFITCVIQHQPKFLENELGYRLWQILVGIESTSEQDRAAGWQILTTQGGPLTYDKNPYIRSCYEQYLPELHTDLYCDGMLRFVQDQVLATVNDTDPMAMEEVDFASNTGIEQLWKVVLSADDDALVQQAIQILAVKTYLDSRAIMSKTPLQRHQLQWSLVSRCLRNMSGAARKIRAATDGTTSGEDESMVVVASDDEMAHFEKQFVRSLRLLRYFLEEYQSRPIFSAPDIRSLMPSTPSDVRGVLTCLKYQSFDGDVQTAVMPLNIGLENTAGCLLASLRKETGFDNYKVYYRGHLFVPSESDICKSLHDLQLKDGLMLVKKEQDTALPPVRVRPGSSSLEIEILAYFEEFWSYLNMADNIAREIYGFLMKLPAEDNIMDLVSTGSASYKDLFVGQQPFKSLYTLYSFCKCIRNNMRLRDDSGKEGKEDTDLISSEDTNFGVILRLVTQALNDKSLTAETPESLQPQLLNIQLDTLETLLKAAFASNWLSGDIELPSDRLLEIIASVNDVKEPMHPSLVTKAFQIVMFVAVRSTQFWLQVTRDARFRPVVQHLCLQDKRRQLRGWIAESIKEAVDLTTNLQDQESDIVVDEAQNSLICYFWSAGYELLDEAMKLPHQTAELFRLLQSLLVAMNRVFPNEVDLADVATRVGAKLLQHFPAENLDLDPSQADKFCSGLVILLHICVKLDPASVSTATLPDHCLDHKGIDMQIDFPVEIFWRYLFPRCNNKGDSSSDNLIHEEDTRINLSWMILHLTKTDPSMLRPILRAMNEIVPYFVKDESDPYFYQLPFQFEPSTALKSSCGYVGLVNLSNTCYLNSLMTQLFMNVGFRRFMLSVPLKDQGQSQKLLAQTQNLFGFLQESMERSKEPIGFVNSIKTYDDTIIDVHSQMDVDEFYNLLFDRWEGQMRNSDERTTLRSFYSGQLVQQIKSKECEHISERLDSFSAIQCDIKGKTTLEESLQAYVDGEIMEGDNKYKCTSCDRHVDAVKRACLKDVPDHMIFHLKRFDFNLRTLQRNKINDYFAFPPFIDLHPYTVDYLSGAAESGITDTFELVGVLVHTGTAESGHYYSYIKERPSDHGRARWIEFNDDHVNAWDPSRMEDMTFGGSQPRFALDEDLPGNGNKPYSAYMLFYQRSSSLSAEHKNLKPREVAGPMRVPMNSELKSHIVEENSILIRRHYMYGPCFVNLVERCANLAFEATQEIETGEDGHGVHELAMEVSLSVLDQIVSRTDKLPNMELFSALIEKAVKNCSRCALSIFDYFASRRYAFRCLLQRNVEPRVRIFMRNLLNLIWERIAINIPEAYLTSENRSPRDSSDSDDDMMSLQPATPAVPARQSVIESTTLLFNYLWKSFHINIRSWDEYFGAVVDFAKRGDCEVSYILAADYLSKSLQIISADQSTDPPANYARMLQNILRRSHTRAVSYGSILMLIDYLLSQLEMKLGPDTIVDDPVDRLLYKKSPFPWTANEIQLVHSHPDNEGSSHFVEKLLAIAQAPDLTYRILSRLIKGGERIDEVIFHTFQRLTNLEASTVEPLDPFLRGAAIYLTSTSSTDHAERLIGHICAQAQAFQNGEGAAFLDFVRTSLNPNRDDPESNQQISQYSLDMLPLWTPVMLVYLDGQVRRDTEDLIDEHVLRPLLANQDEEMPASEEREAKMKMLEGVAVQIAKRCLLHLIDNHVKQPSQLLKDAAVSISRVLARCSEFVERTDEITPEEKDEFLATRDEAMNAIRPMVVETIEEELSDWSNSALSSDHLDDVLESGYFG